MYERRENIYPTTKGRENRKYTMNLTRWRPTILHLGAEAAELFQRTARCGVGSAIAERATFEYSAVK